jgi:hypothetical protein
MLVVIVLPVSEPTTTVKIEAAGDWRAHLIYWLSNLPISSNEADKML